MRDRDRRLAGCRDAVDVGGFGIGHRIDGKPASARRPR
jgi:hypothetical protein